VHADTITVCWDGSVDYTTIREGIRVAVDGDEVVICEGTYIGPGNRNIDFSEGLPEGETRAITVRSTDPCNPAVVAATVIDCKQKGRGFYFHSGETAKSTLAGITITNGRADNGGGIYCISASPTISNCTITGNVAKEGTVKKDGGGIYCYQSNPIIADCNISGNTAGDGGGIYCENNSSPTITNCTISGNTAKYGGGISCSSGPVITNCTISRNTNGLWGGATLMNCTIKENYGYGISDARMIYDCIIIGNGGIGISCGGATTISNCMISANSYSGIHFGGGDSSTVTNCVIVGNTSDYGGGMSCHMSSPTIINCTIAGNSASSGSGKALACLLAHTPSNVQITNCILWDGGSEIYTGNSTVTITYSNIQGGWSGTGNKNVNPLFVDMDGPDNVVGTEDDNVRLSAGSQCLDVGNNASVPPSVVVDMDANPRIMNGTVDMGAYEFVTETLVTVPNVTGMGQADAESAIISAGLIVGSMTCEYSNSVSEGCVISQNPPGEIHVIINSEVDLVVSDGQDPNIATVPNIVRLTQSDAELTITSANLAIGNVTHQYSNTVPEGYVAYQDPPAETYVIINSEVDFVISDGPYPDAVLVPNIAGMVQIDAESTTTSASLTVGDITYMYSSIVPEGCVVSQYPPREIYVTINSDVDFVVSRGLLNSSSIYVDNDASDGGNGMSWTRAFTNLQDALSALDGCSGGVNEIHVAEGVYKPDRDFTHPNGTGDRNATFQLINNITIKGGYAGLRKPYPDTRNIETNETILSGDLNGNDIGNLDDPSRNDNSYNVVTGHETDMTAVLDGFIITGGNANDDSVVLFYRSGGGMFNYEGSPTLANCTFSENSAELYGGGMFNYISSPILTNCTFSGNKITDSFGGGGGMKNFASHPMVLNCIFSKNLSGNEGGGMANYKSRPTLTNCTFSRNSADYRGGGIFSRWTINTSTNKVALTNCIFWYNSDDTGTDESAQIYTNNGISVVNYSCVQGWTGALGGTGNIGTDPCFADVDNGDYHFKSQAGRWKFSVYTKLDPTNDGFIDLVDFAAFANYWQKQGSFLPADLDNSGLVDLVDLRLLLDNYLVDYSPGEWVVDDVYSPCIDAGDPDSDWTAELWPHGKRINKGAFGGRPQASMSPSSVGNIADLNNDDVVGYTDLMLFTDEWPSQEILLPQDLDRNGVVNFPDFAIFANNWLWEE
jgi:beta-lactam-binding protein with PASTA domain